MNKMKLAVSFIGALLCVALAGCMFVSGPLTGEIVGVVTDAGAGAPVEGARVYAYPMDGSPPKYSVDTGFFRPVAFTDAQGRYELVVPKGRYVVEASKDGFAGSRVEGVDVTSTVRMDLIQKPAFNKEWSVTPPDVSLWIEDLHDPAAGAYTGPIDFRVDVAGDNDIQLIYAALGKTPGAGWTTGTRLVYSNTYTTGDAQLDPAAFGAEGWTTFEVVVYDQNDNRTHHIRPLYIEPQEGAALRPAPAMTALAVTVSKQLAFYGGAMTIATGRGEVEIQAAPSGANLYVELRWGAAPDDGTVGGAGISGYRIYRRLQGEADYRPLATVAAGDAVFDEGVLQYYLFRDSSPQLRAGLTAHYQVRAYVGEEESAAVDASCTPLGTWDVRLLGPGEGEVGVSTTPTFTWEPTRLVGNDQVYTVWIWDLALGYWAYLSDYLVNETECTWEDVWLAPGIPKEGTPWERLQPHRIYEWYVDSAVAYDDFADPTAVSVAVNDGVYADFIPVPATDKFSFTTGEE